MDRVYSLLGLATKAGKVESGGFLTEEAIRRGTAKLVILSSDARKNTEKTIRDKCAFYHVPLYVYGTGEALGHAIGKELRSCAAVTDAGFAEKVSKLIDLGMRGNNGEDENQ